jgi:hypothetical protein
MLKYLLLCFVHIYTFKSLAPISIQRHKLLFIWVHCRRTSSQCWNTSIMCHVFCNRFKEIPTRILISFSISNISSSCKSSALTRVKLNGVFKAMSTHIRLCVPFKLNQQRDTNHRDCWNYNQYRRRFIVWYFLQRYIGTQNNFFLGCQVSLELNRQICG